MATSKIEAKVKQATMSGTTNSNGAIAMSQVISPDKTVLSVGCATGTLVNGMCIPWIYDNAIWYVKIVDWTNMTAYGNRAVSLVIRYID